MLLFYFYASLFLYAPPMFILDAPRHRQITRMYGILIPCMERPRRLAATVRKPRHGITFRPWFKRSRAILSPFDDRALLSSSRRWAAWGDERLGQKQARLRPAIDPAHERKLRQCLAQHPERKDFELRFRDGRGRARQTPVLTSLFISGTNKWVFNGVKVQSLNLPLLAATPWSISRMAARRFRRPTSCS